MNKKYVNDTILKAREALVTFEIAENGEIPKTFRSHISAFGAAVVMGSLPAAVAFFSACGQASVDRTRLIRAIYYCITGEIKDEKQIADIMTYVCKNNSAELREKFSDTAIALKLAMNFFDLK